MKFAALSQNGVSSTKTTPWTFTGIPLGGTGAGFFGTDASTFFSQNASYDAIDVAKDCQADIEGYVRIEPRSSSLLPLTLQLAVFNFTTGSTPTPGSGPFVTASHSDYLLPTGAAVTKLDLEGDAYFMLHLFTPGVSLTAGKSYALSLLIADGVANWRYRDALLQLRSFDANA